MIKKILILFITSVIALFSINAEAQKKFQVKVTVRGIPKDSVCRLANHFGDKQYLQDSAKVDASGTVIFKGDSMRPGGIYLMVLPNGKYFEIVVDKEQQFSMETDTADYVKHMKITGSRDNELFYDYLRFIGEKSQEMETLRKKYEQNADKSPGREQVKKEMEEVNKKVIDMKTKFMADNPDALMTKVFRTTQEPEVPETPKKPDGTIDSSGVFYTYKEHFFSNVDMADARLLRTPVLFPKIEQWMKKLTLQMPDSIIAAADKIIALARPSPDVFKFCVWWITNQYETSSIMGMDAVFVHMAKKYYNKETAFWADSTTLYKLKERAKILEPILIGKKMRSMVLKDTSGVYRSMYDIKKPYTVLLIWDPDCGHCKTAIPKMKTLYDKVKGHGVEVYAVNNEAEREKWLKFINEKNLNWINVADMEFQNNFRYELDIHSTPQLFLLDSEKKILAKKIDVETLSEILSEKLGIDVKMPKDPKEKQEETSH